MVKMVHLMPHAFYHNLKKEYRNRFIHFPSGTHLHVSQCFAVLQIMAPSVCMQMPLTWEEFVSSV